MSNSARPKTPLLPLDDVSALIKVLDDLGPDASPLPTPELGRIRRLQIGYNPNSSSLGTSVVMLLWGMSIATFVLQAAAAVLLSKRSPQLTDGSEGDPR